jgi:hypothetical protein
VARQELFLGHLGVDFVQGLVVVGDCEVFQVDLTEVHYDEGLVLFGFGVAVDEAVA